MNKEEEIERLKDKIKSLRMALGEVLAIEWQASVDYGNPSVWNDTFAMANKIYEETR